MKPNTAETLKPYILSLCSYMQRHGYVSGPIPKVRLVKQHQDGSPLEVMTGHFDPDDDEIVLYVADRHPKDILRTLAHELIHVQQHHEGRLGGFDGSAALKDDPVLRSIEGEAFLKGNLALRDWTEEYTHSDQ